MPLRFRNVADRVERLVAAVVLATGVLASCRLERSFESNDHSILGSYYRTEESPGASHSEASLRDAATELLFEIDGPVVFREDDRDLLLATPAAKLVVRERGAAGDRIYSRNGAGDERYVVDGQVQPIDDDAREWLARCVAALIERTPLGAEQRAERILQRDGVAGVTRELERVRNARARSTYLRSAIGSGELGADGVAQAVRAAAKSDLSESTRVDLCLMAAPVAADDPALTSALLDATAPITSSSHRARMLEAVLDRRPLDAAAGERLLESAGHIASTSTRSALLVRALDSLPPDEALRARWLEALRGCGSSDTQRALNALMARGDVTSNDLRRVASAAREVSSTSARAALLAKLALHPRADRAALDEVRVGAQSVSSSSDAAEVLLALLERPELDRASLERIAEVANGVSSMSARDRVQQRLIQRLLEATPSNSPR